MSITSWNDLKNTYKHLFTDPEINGFELFDNDLGWYLLVKILLKNFDENCKGVKIWQIKEKWGALRVNYTCDSDSKDKAYIYYSFASDISAETCFSCGRLGENKERNGYCLPLCDQCEK